MRCAGCSSATAARQIRCGRSFFKQCFEHGVWTSRHGEHLVKDHDWGRRGVHAAGADALSAGSNWFSFGAAIDDAGYDFNADADTGAIARCDNCTSYDDVTGSARGLTGNLAEVGS